MKLRDPAALIDDLYAGALDDEAWTRASVAVGEHVGATGVHLFAYNPAREIVTRTESHRIDPYTMEVYQDYYFSKDILIEPFQGAVIGEPTPEHRLVSLETWQRSQIYNELAAPFDIPYLLITLLHRSPDKVAILSLKTSANHGPFSMDEATRLKRFVPSIIHVMEIKDRLATLQIRADTLAYALNSVNFGVVVLDAGGRIIESNSVANAIFRAGDSGIQVNSRQRIEAIEPTGQALYRWIIEGTPPTRHFDGLFHVPRPSKPPISLLISPLPPKAHSWIGGDPRWMVLLFDPERHLPVSVDLLSRDLGVSQREAEVAALLAIGYDLKGASERLRITQNTIRTHLKSLFSKSGIRSQAELVRRVAGSPAVVPSQYP